MPIIKFINIFGYIKKNEKNAKVNKMYDTIKEGGSMRILGHLMRIPASSYFFLYHTFEKYLQLICFYHY